MKLEIPLEIPTQNATERGRTWRARAAGTKSRRNTWCHWCRSKMVIAGVKEAKGKRWLHVIAYRSQRCADIANLIGGFKSCLDGLVDAGLLMDDRDILAEITYEQQVASKSPTKKPHTTIIISDLSIAEPIAPPIRKL